MEAPRISSVTAIINATVSKSLYQYFVFSPNFYASVICDYMFKLTADIYVDEVSSDAACTLVKGTILFVTFESFPCCLVMQSDDSKN